MKRAVNSLLFGVRVKLVFTRPVSDKILDFFYSIVYGKSKQLPFIDDSILLMTATDLARKIREKELSAVTVMEAYIKRIKAVQPIINACTHCQFEEAIEEANAVDRMLEAGIKSKTELASEMPLLGVPFTCKERIGIKNFLWTFGMEKFKNRVAQKDSDAASLYKRAGAIPLAVTNVPTMSFWWDTYNPVFGLTKNPYDTNRSAGGSSGGEAALISSAGSLIGIGNDLGGCIRIPCSFCGVYGHKPSTGIISSKTSYSGMPETNRLILEKYNGTGPICRYVQDLHLLVKLLSCNDMRLKLDEQVDLRSIKVYYMEELPGCLLSAVSDVKESVRKAVRHLEEKYRITAQKLKMKELKYGPEMWLCKTFEAVGPFMNATFFGSDVKPDYFWQFLKCTFGKSNYDYRLLYLASIEFRKKNKFYYKYLEMYQNVEEKLGNILDNNAILLLPVQPEAAPHPIVTIPKLYNFSYCCVFNILGFPCTSIPAGLSNGLPVGLQIVAKKDCDRLTLAAATELDKLFGGWRNPSSPYTENN